MNDDGKQERFPRPWDCPYYMYKLLSFGYSGEINATSSYFSSGMAQRHCNHKIMKEPKESPTDKQGIFWNPMAWNPRKRSFLLSVLALHMLLLYLHHL